MLLNLRSPFEGALTNLIGECPAPIPKTKHIRRGTAQAPLALSSQRDDASVSGSPSAERRPASSAAESALARARAYAEARNRDLGKNDATGQLTNQVEGVQTATNALDGTLGRARLGPREEASQGASLPETPTTNKTELWRTESTPTQSKPKDIIEVEIVTRDGVIKKQLSRSEMSSFDERPQASRFAALNKAPSTDKSTKVNESQTRRKPELKLSSSDFAGLGFADEPKRGPREMPAGLQAPADAPSQLPQVEIITRDASGDESAGNEDDGRNYKPKVATWGVFPRPRDISRTYGGGRTLRPGEALETEEEKKARDEKTRRLLDEYARLVGLKIDPQVKSQCEKALESGNDLMDRGKLSEAVTQFNIVLNKIPFQNDLHGKAGIQKAMCLDSMARNTEAKGLYEKLLSHPNPSVKRKCQQMLFGFRAAENLKFSGDPSWRREWFQSYFDQVSRQSEYNNFYKAETEEENSTLAKDSLIYGGVLLMPVLMLLLVVVAKRV